MISLESAETPQPSAARPKDIAPWVRQQLQGITKLLKSDPVKVKSNSAASISNSRSTQSRLNPAPTSLSKASAT